MPDEIEIVVFYSWQSDLPKTTNLQAIRTALRTASSNAEADLSDREISIRIDEATKRTSGSPNIPDTILRKIAVSDIFVCDVTPIYKASAGHPKSSANPNVIFELGYAVAQLGWDRVVLLFNESFGAFPQDLPFDFDRHRASPYKLAEASVPKKGGYAPLIVLLTEAIVAVIRDDPKKPSEMSQLTPEQTRRQRDVKNLRWLLENIHWPTLEQHIDEAPKVMPARVLHFYEGFHGVRTAKLFHIFDNDLLALIDAIHSAWSRTTSFGTRYERVVGGDHYIFTVPPNRAWTKDEEKAWAAIERGIKDLHKAIEDFLRYVRTNYLEIDIDELNEISWKRYVQFHQEFEKSIARRK
ncbi:hypothetical protein FTO74_06650 [Granulicella sp. WH15]|uniref:TIR domain-containing protein n=1 Tax=Granulicella sp. WH15 TaxID=2602070 RepID=UPI0013671775|nr:TIR domain-containing protein [Granulicella sp. WH15]QHN03084.1 hypothetical protein FTO74_06650 [Granulicella sp. WH15]